MNIVDLNQDNWRWTLAREIVESILPIENVDREAYKKVIDLVIGPVGFVDYGGQQIPTKLGRVLDKVYIELSRMDIGNLQKLVIGPDILPDDPRNVTIGGLVVHVAKNVVVIPKNYSDGPLPPSPYQQSKTY